MDDLCSTVRKVYLNMFKKRIGITQRVVKHTDYDEIMDCLDTNWTKLLIPLNILPIPLPLISTTHVESFWKALNLDGLILSGGNTLANYADERDKPENISPLRDAYEEALLGSALKTNTPILGICRGLQMINVFYNGKLKKIKGHSGSRHLLVQENLLDKFKLPTEVNSFHDCAIPRKYLGKDLVSFAHDTEDNIEAIYHLKDNVIGIMWHPERNAVPLNSDCNLIKNHFGL